jgi:uncharacterized membrane protein
MFERTYRERLEADLARWQADGVISVATRSAIRDTFAPLPVGVGLAAILSIVGGLLIAAACLAFIAANWTEIARPVRFAVLLAGIAGAYGIGAWFAQAGRALLADLSASVGTIIFGAAVALVGQMYHLGDDFSGGLLLWASGAMVAALLTGSRGALAIALAAGCGWSGGRLFELAQVPYLPFIPLWLIGAGLAVAWNSPVARHLVGAAALVWWIAAGAVVSERSELGNPNVLVAAGSSLLFGAGLALASRGPDSLRALGRTLSTYGAMSFAVMLALAVSGILGGSHRAVPTWMLACGVAGIVLALAGAAMARRTGPALAALSMACGLAVLGDWVGRLGGEDEWLSYALALVSMVSLVASGMLDDARRGIVAGWLGLAGVIAAITWTVEGSLLQRALFLALAGAAAIVLAIVLGRMVPKEEVR